VASFIGEFASGITITIFNYMILSISGNIGVAAYGIIANIAIVSIAICNGVSSGNQPLVSHKYGERKMSDCKYLLRLGIITVLVLSLLMYTVLVVWSDPIIASFNKSNSKVLHDYAKNGLYIYFFGFFFAGLNAILSGFFSAILRPKEAFVISMLRGVILIGVFAIIFGFIFGMNGVWASFPVAEGVTLVVSIALYFKTFLRKETKE
jgi:Na+-driven multidrug efflux pump